MERFRRILPILAMAAAMTAQAWAGDKPERASSAPSVKPHKPFPEFSAEQKRRLDALVSGLALGDEPQRVATEKEIRDMGPACLPHLLPHVLCAKRELAERLRRILAYLDVAWGRTRSALRIGLGPTTTALAGSPKLIRLRVWFDNRTDGPVASPAADSVRLHLTAHDSGERIFSGTAETRNGGFAVADLPDKVVAPGERVSMLLNVPWPPRGANATRIGGERFMVPGALPRLTPGQTVSVRAEANAGAPTADRRWTSMQSGECTIKPVPPAGIGEMADADERRLMALVIDLVNADEAARDKVELKIMKSGPEALHYLWPHERNEDAALAQRVRRMVAALKEQRRQAFEASKPHCPRCKRKDTVIPIVYGYPSQAGLDAAARGEIVLGGCLVMDKKWFCKQCLHAWESNSSPSSGPSPPTRLDARN